MTDRYTYYFKGEDLRLIVEEGNLYFILEDLLNILGVKLGDDCVERAEKKKLDFCDGQGQMLCMIGLTPRGVNSILNLHRHLDPDGDLKRTIKALSFNFNLYSNQINNASNYQETLELKGEAPKTESRIKRDIVIGLVQTLMALLD